MADIPSSKTKLDIDEVQSDNPETEILNTRIGASLNGIVDDTDTNETRIASFEAKNFQEGSTGSGSILAGNTAVVASDVITPSEGLVYVRCSGYIADATYSLELRRNAVAIYTLDISGFIGTAGTLFEFTGINILDSGVTQDAVNTYQLFVTNEDGSITANYTDCKIDLVEFK